MQAGRGSKTPAGTDHRKIRSRAHKRGSDPAGESDKMIVREGIGHYSNFE
jgi:hypothetical protein